MSIVRCIDWSSLSTAERGDALQRPAQRGLASAAGAASAIIEAVRSGGDVALAGFTEKFDGVRLSSIEVTAQEFSVAETALDALQHQAIALAIGNVRRFHAAQQSAPLRIETAPGVMCERRSVPVRAVGLYVPAGSAPLPSTAIMLAVPAAIAACPVRVMCTPPSRSGAAHPAVLVAAREAGIERVFKVGGAQAIAAMAYGTPTIPKCDKVFGPGNAWVTAAKMRVAQDPEGAAADLPAGVSEVMVIADHTARPEFIAADLLAQAEHSSDAQSILLTTSWFLADQVVREVKRQSVSLTRAAILSHSLANMRIVVVDTLDSAIAIANDYAPEHLMLQVLEPRAWLDRVTAAGAVFLGNWSSETTGDYCSGPNHTLPTYGYARAHSGLSVEDFQKRITVQELTPAGLRGLGPTAQVLASLEGLDAHAAAVTVRLAALGSSERQGAPKLQRPPDVSTPDPASTSEAVA